MNTTKHEQMWESLQDPDFRQQFIDEYINVGIAFQIHGLRERQGLKQKQLAERLGDEKKQPLISAWENPNYGKYTLGTLKDLAKAFDVGLLVRFVPFSTLVDWTINLTYDVIAPPSFSEEQNYAVASIPTTSYDTGDTKEKPNMWDANIIELSDIEGSSNISTYIPKTETEKEPIYA